MAENKERARMLEDLLKAQMEVLKEFVNHERVKGKK